MPESCCVQMESGVLVPVPYEIKSRAKRHMPSDIKVHHRNENCRNSVYNLADGYNCRMFNVCVKFDFSSFQVWGTRDRGKARGLGESTWPGSLVCRSKASANAT